MYGQLHLYYIWLTSTLDLVATSGDIYISQCRIQLSQRYEMKPVKKVKLIKNKLHWYLLKIKKKYGFTTKEKRKVKKNENLSVDS